MICHSSNNNAGPTIPQIVECHLVIEQNLCISRLHFHRRPLSWPPFSSLSDSWSQPGRRQWHSRLGLRRRTIRWLLPRYESRYWRPVRLGARWVGVARRELEMGRRRVLDGPMRLQVHRYLLSCHLLPLLPLLPHSVDEFSYFVAPVPVKPLLHSSTGASSSGPGARSLKLLTSAAKGLLSYDRTITPLPRQKIIFFSQNESPHSSITFRIEQGK